VKVKFTFLKYENNFKENFIIILFICCVIFIKYYLYKLCHYVSKIYYIKEYIEKTFKNDYIG
jgi:hypothetical protein